VLLQAQDPVRVTPLLSGSRAWLCRGTQAAAPDPRYSYQGKSEEVDRDAAGKVRGGWNELDGGPMT
jgi:hypothetical protein